MSCCFRTTASPQAFVNHGWEEGQDNWRRDGVNLCMRESKFLWKNSQDEVMLENVVMEDQSRSLMAAWRPCQSAWMKCPTRRRWGGSLISAREMLTLTSTWWEEPIGARKNSTYFQGNLSKSDPEEMEYHWLRSGSGNWPIESVPMSHRKLLLKCYDRWERSEIS